MPVLAADGSSIGSALASLPLSKNDQSLTDWLALLVMTRERFNASHRIEPASDPRFLNLHLKRQGIKTKPTKQSVDAERVTLDADRLLLFHSKTCSVEQPNPAPSCFFTQQNYFQHPIYQWQSSLLGSLPLMPIGIRAPSTFLPSISHAPPALCSFRLPSLSSHPKPLSLRPGHPPEFSIAPCAIA